MNLLMVVSDNHRDLEILAHLANLHPDYEYYLHCGDSELTEDELRPFVSVKGNNDYLPFPKQRLIPTESGAVLMVHGHLSLGPQSLARQAQSLGANLVLVGHSHTPSHQVIDGVQIVNPGALSHPRGGHSYSYALLRKTPEQRFWEVSFHVFSALPTLW